MTLQDIFYLTSSIGFIVITIVLIYVSYVTIATLKAAQKTFEGLRQTGESLSLVKESFRFGAFKFASNLLSMFKGGDETDGQR